MCENLVYGYAKGPGEGAHTGGGGGFTLTLSPA